MNATVVKDSTDRASQEFSVALQTMDNTAIPINNVNYNATSKAVNDIISKFFTIIVPHFNMQFSYLLARNYSLKHLCFALMLC